MKNFSYLNKSNLIVGTVVIVVIAVLGFQYAYKLQPIDDDEIIIAIEENQPCKGEPIIVDYSYDGGYLGPNECGVQCEEKKQKFIYYTNGQATQCEPNLGCFDTGEDRNITCRPPKNIK